ncbi:hypothetical protein BH11BAC6_BH11BAC6_05390 [soil metagenome]
MLRYNLNQVTKARGITKVSAFLEQCGFSSGTRSKIKLGRSRTLDLQQVETICKQLRCTPNEIIEWVPAENEELPADHPLKTLIQTNDAEEIMQLVHGLSLEKIKAAAAVLREIANSPGAEASLKK